MPTISLSEKRTQVQMPVKANFLFPALGKKQCETFLDICITIAS